MDLIGTHICMTKDVGVHGNLFGGYMMCWMDELAAAYVSQYCDSPNFVTRKVSEIDFIRPVKVGHLIKFYGKIISIGTTSITIEIEARRHNVEDGEQKLACKTQMVFVRIDDLGEKTKIYRRVKNKFERESKLEEE